MYTRQVWRCPACGREGQVLVHRLDTTGTMEYRRQQSHAAQVRADHCAGDRLEWVTDR
jgi:lysyl-tRNA synthetase class I